MLIRLSLTFLSCLLARSLSFPLSLSITHIALFHSTSRTQQRTMLPQYLTIGLLIRCLSFRYQLFVIQETDEIIETYIHLPLK